MAAPPRAGAATVIGQIRAPDEAGRVIVAIVAYGRAEEVMRCLAALARSHFAAFEVVLVENAGAAAFDELCTVLAGNHPTATALADPSRAGRRARRAALLGGQPILLIEACGNLGYGAGVNLALGALAEVPGWRGVWILNPDTEPQPDALGTLVAYAEAGGYGLVGCRLILAGEGLVQMRGGTWSRLIGRGRSLGYGEPADAAADVAAIERRLEWVSGAAAYATRAFVERVGPMSEKYFLYCEDVEWALRGHGFRLGYAHEAIVVHAHGTAIGSAASIRARSRLSIYLAQRNALLMTREHFAGLYPLVLLGMLALTVDYLLRGGHHAFAAACRGWWAGLRGETGRPERLL